MRHETLTYKLKNSLYIHAGKSLEKNTVYSTHSKEIINHLQETHNNNNLEDPGRETATSRF